MSSPVGPAEQLAGGSDPKSWSSFWIRFCAIPDSEEGSHRQDDLGAAIKHLERNKDVPERHQGRGQAGEPT